MANPTHTALITGASGGIGRDLAQVFARQGYNLIVVARSEDKLQALADELTREFGVAVTVVAQDLTAPDAPAALERAVQAAGLQVDVLVNNAGFADYAPFVEADLEKQLRMLQLNGVVLTHLTHIFLQGMVARGYGRILNVASTAAFMPGPLMSVYYASKAYVLSFSEAIANELKGSGVTVTALCPGPTQTGFQARAEMEESRLLQFGLMNSNQVAEEGFEALLRGQTIYVPGLMNRMQALMPRFLPRSLVRNVVRQAQERTTH